MRVVKGFTLIEMLITVAIAAILASIAVPAYSGYVLRAKITEMAGVLAAARVRMEQYYQDNRTYAAAGCVTTPTENFTVTCPAGSLSANAYVIQAVGIAAKGTGGFTFTLNQDNVKQTTAVPSGWTLPSQNCYVQKKGGQC